MIQALSQAQQYARSFLPLPIPIEPPARAEAHALFKQRMQARFEEWRERLRAWMSEGERVRENLRLSFGSDAEVSVDEMAQLTALIEALSLDLTAEQERYEEAERRWDWLAEQSRSASTETRQLLTELREEALGLLAEAYNARVDFYYFLIAVRAEHDPEAKEPVGPPLERPEDVTAYFARFVQD